MKDPCVKRQFLLRHWEKEPGKNGVIMMMFSCKATANYKISFSAKICLVWLLGWKALSFCTTKSNMHGRSAIWRYGRKCFTLFIIANSSLRVTQQFHSCGKKVCSRRPHIPFHFSYLLEWPPWRHCWHLYPRCIPLLDPGIATPGRL